MLTTAPLAGCTSTALCSSLKVRTALDSLPFESGAATRLKDVSSATPKVQARSMRRAGTVFFTILEVYRSGKRGRAGCQRIAGAPFLAFFARKPALSLSKGGEFHPV